MKLMQELSPINVNMNLIQDFDKALVAYDSHTSYVANHAKNDVWTNGHYYNAEPFDFERNGFKQGSLLKSRPKSIKNKYCYIFDENNTLLEIKQGLSMPDQFNQEFFFKEGDVLKSCLYGNNKSLINVKSRIFEDNRIKEIFLLGKRGSKHEVYYYEEDVLKKIRVNQWNSEHQGVSFSVDFIYKDGNLYSIINKFDNGYQEIKYGDI